MHCQSATAAIVLLPVALPHPGKLLKRGAPRLTAALLFSEPHVRLFKHLLHRAADQLFFHACWRRC
jgi:hypothetical protein